MTARYRALAILDLAWIALAMAAGLGVTITLLGHALWVGIGYAIWLRSDLRGGFAAAVLGLAGPVGLIAGAWLGGLVDRLVSHQAQSSPPRPMLRPTPVRRQGAALAMARLLDGRVHYPAPEGLDSLVVILRHGSVAARRRALETVVRAFEPGLSPLVAQMLDDPDQTIRALAAAAAARIGQNLAEQRAALEGRIAVGDLGAVETLARLLGEHGRANRLLSDSQRQNLRDEAATLLKTGGLAAESDRLAVEAAWAARDFATIDRLYAAADADDEMAPWWRAEAAR